MLVKTVLMQWRVVVVVEVEVVFSVVVAVEVKVEFDFAAVETRWAILIVVVESIKVVFFVDSINRLFLDSLI